MNPLPNLLPLAEAFGLMVAHSLWQITLIWLVFKMVEWKLSTRHQAVYLSSLVAMLAAAAWASITFLREWSRLQPMETSLWSAGNHEIVESSILGFGGATTNLSYLEITQVWLERYAAPIGWAWLICAGLLWLRLLGGWWLTQRLRRQDVAPAGKEFQKLCDDWANCLEINAKIPLIESPHISEPLTLGFWKPVVLFPVGMLLQLTPAQVEALLLHELAHIRRHDYLLNLFQLGLEVCFFYHPLFWLLSREARSRREFCCDEVVMKHTSNPMLYAKTLTDIQLSLLKPTTPYVMNATGKNRFTERILHIVGISPKQSTRPNLLFVLLLPLLIALSSWWPASPEPAWEEAQDLPTIPVLDTTPPRNALADPRYAKPRDTVIPAPKQDLTNFADDLGKQHPNQRLGVNLAPELPENVAIEVVKMNVLYIGVDNPLRIAAAGVPANELQVELIGEGYITGSGGEYTVVVKQPGEVKVRVMRKVGDEIKFVVDQTYRVKRIPDPAPKLDGKYHSSSLSPEIMQQSKGIFMQLENFEFDAYCEVIGFEATYLPMAEDPRSIMNRGGGAWDEQVQKMIKMAKPGDTYFFDDIIIKCPGDAAPRNAGGLAFKIRE